MRIALALLAVSVTITTIGYSQTITKYSLPSSNLLMKEDEIGVSFFLSTYNTSSNFDSKSIEVNLKSENNFESNRFALNLKYGNSSSFNLFANLTLLNNTLSAGDLKYTYTAPSDNELGLRSRLLELEVYRLDLEFFFVIPLYRRLRPNEWEMLQAKSRIPLGNGIIEAWLGVINETTFFHPKWALGLALGAGYRSLGFSAQGVGEFYVKYNPSKKSFISGGLKGETPIMEDYISKLTPQGAHAGHRGNTVIGGSHIYNSMNPTILNSYVNAGINVSQKVYLSIFAEFTHLGKNISSGTLFGAGFGAFFGGTSESTPPKIVKMRTHDEFTQYSLTATITKYNKSLSQFLIDRGLDDDVRIGNEFDIFKPEAGTLGIQIGTAKVIESGSTTAKLTVTTILSDEQIKEGFVVRKSMD